MIPNYMNNNEATIGTKEIIAVNDNKIDISDDGVGCDFTITVISIYAINMVRKRIQNRFGNNIRAVLHR